MKIPFSLTAKATFNATAKGKTAGTNDTTNTCVCDGLLVYMGG